MRCVQSFCVCPAWGRASSLLIPPELESLALTDQTQQRVSTLGSLKAVGRRTNGRGMVPLHRGRRQQELSLYLTSENLQESDAGSTALAWAAPRTLAARRLCIYPSSVTRYPESWLPAATKKCQHFILKNLSAQTGEKNVPLRGADTQKSLLCRGEEGKGGKKKKKKKWK